ncbi:class I SAM-dependent methyltransferase [Ottowia testudinis]|uniref:Class I SAM-dependent methyltransferase n=1 Tax=Ottowia testudinis TaxID=2816950 RepID=A0A975H7Q8_9BURK|nr:class I SAM-dependent methyltransferase [Ottowia testudinis]QTD47312.1 class I SAM-dependent methyltransferase [Ottowia testudinis]
MVMVHAAAQKGFTNQAGAYARGRPEYPAALDGWLRDALRLGPGRHAVDVGAGTGKFAPRLLVTGAGVVAVEPVDAMRARITPHARLRVQPGTAEATGLTTASQDAIVCAQAFHWFSSRAALDEFARVLKPGGRLGLVWNVRDESVDWVTELTRIVSPHEGDAPRFWKQNWREAFPHPAFGPLHETVFEHEHVGPPAQVIVDRFMSVSFIAALPAGEQAVVRAQIENLIATHPALRGRATVRLPYQTLAFVCVRH